MRRKSSPILGGICTLPNNITTSEKSSTESIEKDNPKTELSNQGPTEPLDGNNKMPEDEDSNEEVRLSGCRRRIQNRPTKKSSKSKSFSDTRKFRSNSPLPSRMPTQIMDLPKPKVIIICV